MTETSNGLEDYVCTLFVAKECFVYRLPPRPSIAGYKAQDWGLDKPLLTGQCLLLGLGDNKCVIRLSTYDGEIFAESKLVPGKTSSEFVEPVLDSSRYFVIKVSNEEKADNGESDKKMTTAMLGIGFRDREIAFDFKAAMYDQDRALNIGTNPIQNDKKGDKDEEVPSQSTIMKESEDLSLKGPITLNLFKHTKDRAKNMGGNNEIVPTLDPPRKQHTNTSDEDDEFGEFQYA